MHKTTLTREENFAHHLRKLMQDYSLYLLGSVRIIDGFTDKWDMKTFRCAIEPEVTRGGIKDTTGPFLTVTLREKATEPVNCNLGFKTLISGDIEPYTCPITGQSVGGRAQHRDNLKRHNCRILEKGDKEWARKKRAENFNESVDRTVREAVTNVANEF